MANRNGKTFEKLIIISLVFQTYICAPASKGNITSPSELNGKMLMEIGKQFNLPKLQMIGKTIENVENEIEANMCDLHRCSEWTEWSVCTARVGPFGSKFRTRQCSINMTTCEIDSKSKTEKEFGICIGHCPDGYNLTKNGFCLKLYADKQVNQEDAEQRCQKDGGHLVNIDSEIKFDDVSSVLTGFMNKGIWIDGRRKDVSSPWEYTYGSQKGFFKWHPNQPENGSNELCLIIALYSNGLQWHDASCPSKYYNICEKVSTI